MTRLKTADGLEFDIQGNGPYHWELYHDGLILEHGRARFLFTLAWKLVLAERRAKRRRARNRARRPAS
jgi:hypothetical protein